MPRGPQPQDARLFGDAATPELRAAVHDLSWLLTRGYALNSALKIVGDRFALVTRQREAVRRGACTEDQAKERRRRRMQASQLAGQRVAIDGFNLIIIVESAMAGGVIMRGRDGAIRDLASVHGSYRRAEHTHDAIKAIGATLDACGVSGVDWYLDRPVSNSGRLAGWIAEVGAPEGRDWTVELVNDPDKVLAAGHEVVISSDGWVMSHSPAWVDFVSEVLRRKAPQAWVVQLGSVAP